MTASIKENTTLSSRDMQAGVLHPRESHHFPVGTVTMTVSRDATASITPMSKESMPSARVR